MKKLTLFILITCTFFGFICFNTINHFKDIAVAKTTEFVSQKTGRPLKINEVRIKPNIIPTVAFNNISLGNAVWAENPLMTNIESVEIQLDLFSLICKKIKIKNITLNTGNVNLEVNSKHQNNWTFPKNAIEKSKETAKIADKKSNRLDIDSATITVNNFDISYINEKAMTQNVSIDSLSINTDKENTLLKSQWQINEHIFSTSVKTPIISTVLNENNPFDIDVTTTSSSLTASLKGQISKKNPTFNINAKLNATTSDLFSLGRAFGFIIPDIKKSELTAEITGNLKKPILQSYQLSIGESETMLISANGKILDFSPLNLSADVNLTAPDMGKIAGIKAQPPTKGKANISIHNGLNITIQSFTSGLTDLKGKLFIDTKDFSNIQIKMASNTLNLFDMTKGKTKPIIIKASKEKESVTSEQTNVKPVLQKKTTTNKELFSKTPFNYDKINKANINIDYKIANLISKNNTALGPVYINATMQNGLFDMKEINIAKYLKTYFKFDATTPNNTTAKGLLSIQKMPLAFLVNSNTPVSGTITTDIDLASKGSSENQMATNLNGRFIIKTKNIDVNFSNVVRSLSDFYQIVLKGKENFKADCGVVNLNIKNGMIKSDQNIALESEAFDMQTSGEINLSNEQINLDTKIIAKLKWVSTFLTERFFVTGSLANPIIKAEEKNVAQNVLTSAMSYIQGLAFGNKTTPPAPKKKNNFCKIAEQGTK